MNLPIWVLPLPPGRTKWMLQTVRYVAALVLEVPVAIFTIWLWGIRCPAWLGVPLILLVGSVAWGAAYLVAGTLYMLRYGHQLRAALAVADVLQRMIDVPEDDAGNTKS